MTLYYTIHVGAHPRALDVLMSFSFFAGSWSWWLALYKCRNHSPLKIHSTHWDFWWKCFWRCIINVSSPKKELCLFCILGYSKHNIFSWLGQNPKYFQKSVLRAPLNWSMQLMQREWTHATIKQNSVECNRCKSPLQISLKALMLRKKNQSNDFDKLELTHVPSLSWQLLYWLEQGLS